MISTGGTTRHGAKWRKTSSTTARSGSGQACEIHKRRPGEFGRRISRTRERILIYRGEHRDWDGPRGMIDQVGICCPRAAEHIVARNGDGVILEPWVITFVGKKLLKKEIDSLDLDACLGLVRAAPAMLKCDGSDGFAYAFRGGAGEWGPFEDGARMSVGMGSE